MVGPGGRDAGQSQVRGRLDPGIDAEAPGPDLLGRIEQAALAVEDIGEDRRPGGDARDQTVAAARVAVVGRVIALEADEDVVLVIIFGREAAGPDILVVIIEAGGEILAEAA